MIQFKNSFLVACLCATACTGNMWAAVDQVGGSSTGSSSTGGGDGSGSTGGGGGTGSNGTSGGSNFVALPANSALARVKNLLVGGAPTADEYATFAQDPNSLLQLVQTWRSTEAYQTKMIAFLGNAFQQSQERPSDFGQQGIDIVDGQIGDPMAQQMVQTLAEIYPRTVLALDAMHVPFTQILTTRQFMVTTAAATALCFADNEYLNETFQTTNPVSTNKVITCSGHGFTVNETPLDCILNMLQPADLTDWHMVTVQTSPQGQTSCDYSNTAALRTATTLALKIPRIGYYTTPAFLAGWQTNSSNQARVTANQALIVGLGHAVDGKDGMTPQSLAPIDTTHAAPGSTCYSCHITLDPLRQFYRQAFPISYCGTQTIKSEVNMPGEFALAGVDVVGTNGIGDLGQTIANHPLMPGAWVQKLCTYFNDAPCLTTDPEFQRVTAVFVSSNYNFGNLVETLVTSPLVTYLAPTASNANFILPIAKRDHFCPLLSQRLNIPDICGQQSAVSPVGYNPHTLTGALLNVQTVAAALPADGYSRGAVLPVLSNDPTLFIRAGVEKICASVGSIVIGTGSKAIWPASDPNAALSGMTTTLLGLDPNDAAAVRTILSDHYTAAIATGVSSQDALVSTFTAACTSPLLSGMGL